MQYLLPHDSMHANITRILGFVQLKQKAFAHFQSKGFIIKE